MNITTLDCPDGWPPLPPGPPPVPSSKTSLSSLPSFPPPPPPPPSSGISTGTPPPPGESPFDATYPPGISPSGTGSSNGGLAAWEKANQALAALNQSQRTQQPRPGAPKKEDQENAWQPYHPPAWGGVPPPAAGPMSRFPVPPPYGFPPRPPFGYPRPPVMGLPPWSRPPIRGATHIAGPSRPPMWGTPRPPASSSASAVSSASTTASQPIRFNLQFKNSTASSAPPPPQSVAVPSKPNTSVSVTSEPPKNATPGMAEWPESLRRYVTQCFSRCQTEIDKDQTEIILKGKLTRAFGDGSAWSVDWDKEALPTLHSDKIKEMKKQSQLGSISSPSLAVGNQSSGQGSGYDPMSMFRGRDKGKKGNKQQPQSKQTPTPPPQQKPEQQRKPKPMTAFSRVHGNNARDRSRSRSRSRSPEDRKRGLRGRRSQLGGPGSTGSGSPSDEDDEDDVARGAGRSFDAPRFGGRGKHKDEGRGKKRQSVGGFVAHKNKGKQIGNAPDDPDKEARLAKRAARFQDHLTENSSSGTVSPPVAFGNRKNKKQRTSGIYSRLFNGGSPSMARQSGFNLNSFAFAMGGDEGEIDWSSFAIKGTCAEVEKKYLRLTAAPDPTTVRPPSILRKSLELAKKNWKEKGDYLSTCDALKSIRQDLTVQCIRDAFTVEVYETHARVAIERGDRDEFNQCQTQLKNLYKTIPSPNSNEFTAYRLLYYIYTKNTQEMGAFLAHMTPAIRHDACVQHALAVRSAWSSGNYVKFFRLYTNAPHMSSSLVDFFVERERKEAFVKAVKGYRPSLPVSFVVSMLAFPDIDACRKFLDELQVVYIDKPENTKIDCKATQNVVAL